jgi:hypothetical protein
MRRLAVRFKVDFRARNLPVRLNPRRFGDARVPAGPEGKS